MQKIDPSLHYEKPRACGFCEKLETPTHKLSRCKRCRLIYYCNTDCQTSAWKTHQAVCKDPSPWYTLSDGTEHKITDINDGDRLPVLVVPFSFQQDGSPTSFHPGGTALAGERVGQPAMNMLRNIIAQLPAPPGQAFGMNSLVRPFYVSTLKGKDIYVKATDKPLVVFLSIQGDSSDPSYRFTPVHTKRLDGKPV